MHRRGPSGQYAPGPGMGGSPGPMAQGRTASPYGAHGMGQHGHGHSPMGGAGAMAGGVPGGRNAVLLKEAVLLNSLKVRWGSARSASSVQQARMQAAICCKCRTRCGREVPCRDH